MLAQSKSELCPCCRARFFNRDACRRVRRGPRIGVRRAGPDMNHVSDGIPFAIKLPDLLRIHIEHERHLVIVLGRFCLHPRQIERAPRSCVQDAHQCSLRVAIADVKALHMFFPPVTASVLLPATSRKVPRLPEPSDKHWLPVRNQTQATPVPANSEIDRSGRRSPARPEIRA